MKAPIVAPQPKKPVLKVPDGWLKVADGYQYEKTIYEQHHASSVEKQVLKGTVTVNHMEAALYTYTKDLSDLSEMQEKARILEARSMSYVVSDPEYVAIIGSLHDLKHKIKELSKALKPVVEDELILEEFFSGGLGSDSHTEWQEEQMQRVIAEGDRLCRLHKKPAMPVSVPSKKEELAAQN